VLPCRADAVRHVWLLSQELAGLNNTPLKETRPELCTPRCNQLPLSPTRHPT
jgi:hypothetical protein